jgi:hypothetical protein
VIKVPSNTATNNTEYIPDKDVLPFAPELIAYILNKKKAVTYRLGRKYAHLEVGDRVRLQDSRSGDIVGKVVITSKDFMLFKDIPLEGGGHESYVDKEHQRKVFSGYYAYIGRPIEDKDEFLVLGFN